MNRSAGQIGFFARIPAEFIHELSSYARTPLFLVLFAAGAVWLFRQNDDALPMVRPLKALLIAAYAFNTFVMGKGSGFYYLYPGLIASAVVGLMVASINRNGHWAGRYVKIALTLLVINSFAVIYGPRLLAWRYQKAERRYQVLDQSLRGFDFAGKTVVGVGPEWYTIEVLGAHFEIPYFGFVPFDAAQQDYVIVNVRDLRERKPQLHDFSKVAEIGPTFPRVFGSELTDRDYRLAIFHSNKRVH